MTGFADSQVRALKAKLSEKWLRYRQQDDVQLAYLEGWHVMAEANRIFGFDGWDRETVEASCIWHGSRSGRPACSYVARVRITVHAGERVIVREGSGAGHGDALTLGEAHESALKEAETDATKRALVTFGNAFGLALYDREQRQVRRTTAREEPAAWPLRSGQGGLIGRFVDPVAFCRSLRERIAAAQSVADLAALQRHNSGILTQLRRALPSLRNERGLHYVDLVEGLMVQRRDQLAATAQVDDTKDKAKAKATSSAPTGRIDKSTLPRGEPKRWRDPAHRREVAKLPCLICARQPSHAHHLRFAQPRALGRKVSDEWVVPLCAGHHRRLHDAGNEQAWWAEHRIDPVPIAERLWRRRHQPAGQAAADDPSAPHITPRQAGLG